ncbi:Dihydrolipoyllysine-residue acetyltransferase component of pyruvate dehydrogenase complex, mitochond [Smittium mucronatum]|uniref:Acetyltransferase component of pyruvate dehydrogenase complex n=1 Tax=Smittium mucronatum TaxID=133383 RepID=A0A1R0GR93_9FUNG|nr:Dihydrolipoyllysine-residue acetyltransferase component of pyruvate dehydrogenase complex, mitochond [Smittium mucronatum]
MLSLKTSIVRSASRTAVRSAASKLPIASLNKIQLYHSFSIPRIQKMTYSSSDLPDYTLVAMPALSPTMEMGNIGTWKVKVGDKVEPGDVLVEIETDKAQMDFEYQDSGYIAKLLKDSGSHDVPIETPIAIIVDEESQVDAFKDFVLEKDSGSTPAAAASSSQPSANEASTSELKDQSLAAGSFASGSTGDRVIATPLSKVVASENNVDLSTVKGTGLDGAITKSDVLAKAEEFLLIWFPFPLISLHLVKSAPAVQEKAPAAPAPAAKAPAVASEQPAALGYHDIPVTNMRRVIAKRLLESKTSTPHYTLNIEARVDSLNKLRAALNETSQGKYKLTVNDFIVKAAALALKAVPAVNVSWQDTFIRQYHHADISIATQTPDGLITPIVKTCDVRGLESISNEIKALAVKARAGKLKPAEFQGGSFSISNLGMFGISSFTAIINPPQSAILSVGTTQKKMIPDETNEKGFSVVSVNSFTLNADHRAIDGAVGAEFMMSFKSYIENPLTMLL